MRNRLKYFLFRKKKTQVQLAIDVDCTPTTINGIVQDRQSPSVDLALKIAKELDATVEQIWEEDPKFSVKQKNNKWYSA